jgi:catechol 2,3-dioxygenase-like lactoylglutathione lyase family enzyme
VFDHIGIRVSDREASERFYDTVLSVLGKTRSDGEDYTEWEDDFDIGSDGPPTRHLHIGFYAPTRELVDAFHRAGVEAGYQSDGEPGPRPQYTPEYYGAFLLDPDGNSIEAVSLGSERQPGQIDHLWLRTRDVEAATAFYATIAPVVGLEVRTHSADHVQLVGDGLSFSFVTGEPVTEGVHIAFTATDNATVEAFHAAATSAGYRDNGGPGERTIYHPGYYGAFVLDPDGHNIEAVNHNR